MAPLSVPSAPALTRSVPASPSLVQLPPLYSVGQWQAPPDPVAESLLASAVRALEVPLTPPSQGNVTFDTHPTAVNFALGPSPPVQSASQPLDSGPPPILQLSIPTDGSPEMQYQQLMETA